MPRDVEEARSRSVWICLALAAAIVLALAAAPDSARSRILWASLALCAAGFVLLRTGESDSGRGGEEEGSAGANLSRRSSSSELWRVGGAIAPIDAASYGLRVPQPGPSLSRDPAGWLAASPRFLGRRPKSLVSSVTEAVHLGFDNGNAAVGTRLLASLEDFYARCDRASASPSGARAALRTLSDVRGIALRCLQELQLVAPLPLTGPVQEATRLVRADTLACMQELCGRHARRLERAVRKARSPAEAAAAAAERAGLEVEAELCGCRRDGARGVGVAPFEEGMQALLD